MQKDWNFRTRANIWNSNEGDQQKMLSSYTSLIILWLPWRHLNFRKSVRYCFCLFNYFRTRYSILKSYQTYIKEYWWQVLVDLNISWIVFGFTALKRLHVLWYDHCRFTRTIYYLFCSVNSDYRFDMTCFKTKNKNRTDTY